LFLPHHFHLADLLLLLLFVFPPECLPRHSLKDPITKHSQMNEAATVRLHESLSQSQAVFLRAANTPLLGPSSLPHPALGNVFSTAHGSGHITSSVMASMQQTVEALVLRVAKLESLVFLMETERSTNGGHKVSSSSTVNLFQDVRATLYEMMEPVREQLRRHEAILMDVVQSLNHAAGWGYYKQREAASPHGGVPLSPRTNDHHQHPAALARGNGSANQRQHRKSSLERDDGINDDANKHNNADAFVMVSPLTKADTSHVTAATTAGGPHIDPNTVHLEERIIRMRRLAGVLGNGVPLGSTSHVLHDDYHRPQHKKKKANNNSSNKKPPFSKNDDDVSSDRSSSISERDQSPFRQHRTTADSSTQPIATTSGTTTSTTFFDDPTSTQSVDPTDRRHHREAAGDITNDEAKQLIHNVKRILRKNGGDDGGGLESTSTTTANSSSLLLLQSHHDATNASSSSLQLLSTPQRAVRFGGGAEDPLATPLPARYQTGTMFGGRGGGIAGRIATSDTTTSTMTSSSLGVANHRDPSSNYYRSGVQLLQSPGSATSFQQSRLLSNNNDTHTQHYATGTSGGGVGGALRGLDFQHDSSSLSDGYQELLKRMHM
jgi:hypothetical protein